MSDRGWYDSDLFTFIGIALLILACAKAYVAYHQAGVIR